MHLGRTGVNCLFHCEPPRLFLGIRGRFHLSVLIIKSGDFAESALRPGNGSCCLSVAFRAVNFIDQQGLESKKKKSRVLCCFIFHL